VLVTGVGFLAMIHPMIQTMIQNKGLLHSLYSGLNLFGLNPI
jgi:hypothetical protein